MHLRALARPDGCTAWNATREQRQESVHNEAKFMASYMTGSHNIKVGIENDWGPGRQRKNTRNGHLQQRYTNNQPTQVEVFNNPVIQPAYVAYRCWHLRSGQLDDEAPHD